MFWSGDHRYNGIAVAKLGISSPGDIRCPAVYI
jgi:hypothetical protein